MRFCWLHLKLPPCARVRHGDEWSWRVRDEENAEKRRWGGTIEKEKERCLVLLSCLSVAGGDQQRKLVGCGVSHVYLTLFDSSLCCSVTHSLHSLWEMCDSSAIVPSPNPSFIFLILDLLPSLPPPVYSLQSQTLSVAGGVGAGGGQAGGGADPQLPPR